MRNPSQVISRDIRNSKANLEGGISGYLDESRRYCTMTDKWNEATEVGRTLANVGKEHGKVEEIGQVRPNVEAQILISRLVVWRNLQTGTPISFCPKLV